MKEIKDIIKQINGLNLALFLFFMITFISYPVELIAKASLTVIVFVEIVRVSGDPSLRKTLERFFCKKNAIKLSDEDKKHVSCHEAGHALICKMSDNLRLQGISIKPDIGSAGHILHDSIVIRCNKTKQDYMDEIHIAFGGIMAEEIVFGHYRDGGFLDIKNARRLAFDMLESGYGSRLVYGEKEMREEIERILQKAKNQVRENLSANKDLLVALQHELMENEEMNEKDIRKFFRKNNII